jgi:hypothetical protein
VEQADGRTDVAHADAPRGDGARIGCAGSDRVTGATGLNHAAPETVVVAGRISVIRRRAYRSPDDSDDAEAHRHRRHGQRPPKGSLADIENGEGTVIGGNLTTVGVALEQFGIGRRPADALHQGGRVMVVG